jgi:hypothetical protein
VIPEAGRRRSARPRLRADQSWRLRQLSGEVFLLWFAVAVPLTGAAFLIDPRWVGWVMVAWFGVLVGFMTVVRLADARLRRAWREVSTQLGWHHAAADQELVERWPFPPFTLDPAAEAVEITSGRYRGRKFWTGTFQYAVQGRQLGFDFLDLEVDRPLPPLQILPRSLVPLVAPGQHPPELELGDGEGPDDYRLVQGEADLARAVLHPAVVEVLKEVPSFGFACAGRRFVALLPGYRRSSTALAQLEAACDLLDLMPEQAWQAGEQWVETRSRPETGFETRPETRS